MGTSKTAAQLAGKLRAAGDTIEKSVQTGVLRAAEQVRIAVAVASGPYASSPLAKTRVTLLPGGAAVVGMTSRRAHLLDRDTQAHDILPGAVTGHRGQKTALATPQGPRASAHVKGTRGKLMWEKGVEAARPAIVAAVDGTLTAGLLEVFGP